MTDKRIIRVFPRKTKATPDDENVRINCKPVIFDEADEVHVSVTFTWDLRRAEYLYNQWRWAGFNTKIGGVAFGQPGGEFVPGLYLKKGYVITSRGCPNKCWFCNVHKVQGDLIELPIVDGYIIQDDNLLACSEHHINAVFEMLKRQKNKPKFTGGLEAKLLTQEMAFKLKELKPSSLFFAYDTKNDFDPLIQAGIFLRNAGFKNNSHTVCCYVLIGHKGDTFEKAEKRLVQAWKAGFFPFAMLYRDFEGKYDETWRRFQRDWVIPEIKATKLKMIQYENKDLG
ncbi:MAG: hypothetical protein FWC34_09140 [Bacteroidetes bacterium]|nr:hypothetical protein [Bacteroidota bacterium]